ncbi:globin domain-containing protein [Gandjariella thermophila]|uniref:nitric oxide dioxygenase n=1 Tax=Gandjariella thermophila TaxID=1931992 RepID=A0A4D4JCG3_9PSEU|nr:globin domain-containing protein [Gandjariella thermophila]GDY31553.1 oxidoreductase [Gandjariella thermophila]
MDTARLRQSWNAVAEYGIQLPLFFYSVLFLEHPETRQLFPASMSSQRDKLVSALGTVVSNVENLDSVVPVIQQLGRDHRKFSVMAEHYPAVGNALLTTLEHFLGDRWTPQLAADWEEAYGLVAKVMIEAAEEAAKVSPPWWEAEVIHHEQRTPDIAVLLLRTNQPLDYLPGQSIAVETELRPRLWRYYTPANVPREDGTIELHVRLVDGGAVSTALVQAVRAGDVLRLGAPVGERLTMEHDHDVVLIAGGTGLAPFKALVDQAMREGGRRDVHLFVGARNSRELYDLRALQEYASRVPRLRVVPAVSDDPRHTGERGQVADVALRHGPWPHHEIYVCGSSEMVAGSRQALRAAGIPDQHVRHETFTGWSVDPPLDEQPDEQPHGLPTEAPSRSTMSQATPRQPTQYT